MAEHCWHPTGRTLMSDPPITVLHCCYCNAVGHQRSALVRSAAHGPFAPLELVPRPVEVQSGSATCP